MTQETLQFNIFFWFFVAGIVFYLYQKKSNKNKQPKKEIKQIKETKCTCKACGNIWFYGKKELFEMKNEKLKNIGKEMSNTGNDMMCCGGCFPAAFMPKEQITKVKDLNKCPKCNSMAIQKEEVTHEI